jgi:hypothetical protein
MGPRRRAFNPAVTEATPGAPTPKSGEMSVTLKGDPDVVREKMGMNSQEKAPEESGDQDQKFLDALANEGYQFHVKRILPREWKGETATVVVYNDSCPMLYQDIINEITEHSGGKKYRITISDPTTGKAIAAKTFSIDADPILKKKQEQDDSEMLKLMGVEDPDDAANIAVDKSFERQVKMASQRLTLEQHQDMLESLKRKREVKGASPDDAAVTARIAAMERSLAEDRHAREVDRVRQESDQRIRELSARLDAKPQGQDPQITAILDRMQKAQEASDKRFELMMQNQRDDKANEILRELRATRDKGGPNSFKEQMELFGTVAKTFGFKIPGSDDRDDDEDDDRPWYERLGTQLADKFIPKLLDKLDSMEGSGKKVTKEDFMKEIDAYATQAADAAAAKEAERLNKKKVHELPPPAKTAPAAPAPASGPVSELPPAAPGGAAPAEATPPKAPAEATTPQLTIEQETAINVMGVAVLIERELQMRKQYYQWNYEGAWENLPEDVLERICTAPDCIAMFEAFKVHGVNPTQIDLLKAKVVENPKMSAWLKLGHDELKEWWIQKQEDPKFDPGEEDEEPEETTEQ